MNIKCEKDRGYIFSPKIVREGNEAETKFNGISLGMIYCVYGTMLYEEGVYYLIYDDFEMPNWYPADLFTVTSGSLPEQWYFKYFGQSENPSAIWGYYELVNVDKHFDGLGEQEQDEIDVFLKRKSEMYK
ncbi:phosphoribosylaminoimidazole synthetase [Sporosarcina cyprini]|uniref:phosphoribosylaminoimidazole synthetase n=1 Tax=Sporosarcina cyprini TaxID=2910523 RepID=UPI001EDD583C|nr:phosphoribosylaminoimidazole synthetase [Sporosarcina cyprini]MCG3086907.1 phosphoribosylaminoimidazole synthetase [Sporosarcina cyprini]